MRADHWSSVLLSILLVTSLIVLPSFIITITSQTASANPSSPKQNFTIVVLPDTQFYSQGYPGIFENQTRWIVQNENENNIVFVTHLGDIVNVNYYDSQWQNANSAMSILDNKVPYTVLPGNHDMDGGYSPPPEAGATYYERYFPASRYENYSYWGGSYDHNSVTSSSPNMNNYQLFSAGGMNFIALSLQYNPPADVLSWAGDVLSEYSNRRAIISTHSYLNTNGTLTSSGGAAIWQYVVVPENNVFLVLCGHEVDDSGIGAVEKINNLGNRTVYQLLSDYQGLSNGGNGYLRIMEFAPSENKIYVRTYSPYLNNSMTDNTNQFELSYPMIVVGGVSVLIEPSSQRGLNGDNLRYTVTVNNTENVSDNFNLTVSDNDNWGPTVSPTSLVVPAFSSGSATLSVTVPSGAISGTIDNIWVKATSNNNASVFDNESCLAQVTIIRGFSVSISPSSQSGANGATLNYTVTVNNIGIVDDNYSLSVTDNENWSPSVLPTPLSVSAGSSGNATLSVILGMGIDTITVHATNDNTTGEATCTATGLPISVSLTPSVQHGFPGENLAYTVVVKNLGSTADNYQLTLIDTQPWQAGWNAPAEQSTQVCESTNINVYQDSYVMGGSSAGTNYGGRYNMYVGIYQSNLEYTYTQWNLSSIPANATIDNAYVYMTGQYGPSHGSYIADNMWVEAWNVNNDTWNENVITWNNMHGYGPTLLDNKLWIASTWAGYYAWLSENVTSWVRNQFENGKLASFAFKSNGVGTDSATGNSGWFQTKDSTGSPWYPEYIPYMTVNYHVPAATVSLGPGENWTGTVWVITGASGTDNKTVTATSMTDNTITASATAQATTNGPILIDGNDNFTLANGVKSGSGAENDPYIIENWAINASGAHGITIQNTTAYFIIRNCLVENGGGTYDGIYFDNAINGIVDNNTCKNNFYGIYLDSSSNNNLTGNTCENNDTGIFLVSSSYDNLTNNTCSNNSNGGIWIETSDNNHIYHNNFVNNSTQAHDNGANYWDNGYPSGGNYWSDYAGVDIYHGPSQNIPGSDGIGDTSYNISEGSNQDRYPLMNSFPLTWTGWVAFGLENLYSVRLEENLYLDQGSKLVVKFYKYDNVTLQAESVIENIAPPENIKENENVPHPRAAEKYPWGTVQIARLVLTTDNENEVISTIASFTVRQSNLRTRYGAILKAWAANPPLQSAFRAEIGDILKQWASAPK